MDGFRGILAFTLPEALWLAECGTSDDIVVAYPTADRAALARLAGDAAAAAAITVMVDCPEHLDLIEKAAASRVGQHGPASGPGLHRHRRRLRGAAAGGCTRARAAPRSAPQPTPRRWPPRSSPGRGCAWPG